MKKVTVLLVAMVVFLVGGTAMAFPSLPDDLNIVQLDPALPKELADFSGKWEGKSGAREFYLIVEKIDREKATLRLSNAYGWETMPANIVKEYGKWKIWFSGRYGQNEFSLRGKYLDLYLPPGVTVTFTKVP